MITVLVRATVSFNEVHKGDVSELELTERVNGLISGGYLEVMDRGETEAGPGRFEKSDPGSELERAGTDGPAGGEPGEDPLPG